MVLNSALLDEWLHGQGENPLFPIFEYTPEGGVTAWYSMLLTVLANDCEQNFALDITTAIQQYEQRDIVRCQRWKSRF